MSDPVLIEVCVDSVESAVAAERGGAGRVELSSALLEGGVTPSAGLIELARGRTSIGLHVMVRPRGGDFCYTQEEFETMKRDIVAAQKLGADGVALGILQPDGSVDTARTRQLVQLARPLDVTFHRAFDMASDFFRALEDICSTGANRILTSGGARTALRGADRIAHVVREARGRVVIMAGGGIDGGNAASIMEQTGVREVHAGLRSSVLSPMLHRNPEISMGRSAGDEYERFQVLEESVRKLHRAVAPART
jgi:copper homeostasis protein